MRIIIIVPSFPLNISDVKGGVNSAIINLLHGFEKFNIDVRIISFTKEVNEITVIPFSNKIEFHYEPEGLFPFHSLNYLFFGPGILKRHIKSFKADIIHYQTGNTMMFTRILGVLQKKIILTIHSFAFQELKTKTSIKDKITWWYNGTVNEMLKSPNVIYISDLSKEQHFSKKVKHHSIIPNAIRSDYFDVKMKPKTSNKLIYVGVINNRKNIYTLLNTLKSLIQNGIYFTLDVIGDFTDEEYRNKILTFVNNNDLDNYVTFKGWISQDKLLGIMADVDILVLSSFQETLPMVIAEFMSAGKVIVSSDVGGIPEMIKDKNDGFLFNLKEPDQLVNILESLYNNDELISFISTNAKQSASKKYLCENVAKKTIEFYNECIVG